MIGSIFKVFPLAIVCAAFLLGGCADLRHKPAFITDADVSDDFVTQIYDQRTWHPPTEVPIDPIGLGKRGDIPINNARTKIIGPLYQDALDSLAAKLWMIENAKYTADLVYYIFKRDVVGYTPSPRARKMRALLETNLAGLPTDARGCR